MKSIHYDSIHYGVMNFDNRIELKCGQPTGTGVRYSVTLGDAIKKVETLFNKKLCAGCFYIAVGNIPFDEEPSYGEELANYMNAGNQEIIEAEIMEEEK